MTSRMHNDTLQNWMVVYWFVILVLLYPLTGLAMQSQHQVAMENGLKFIAENQSDDGSWKSEYYGNLKQGAAITSLILFAISNCNNDLIKQHESEIKNAIAFQRLGIKKNGYVSNVSGPDYAVYATSLLLLAHENFQAKSKRQWLAPAEVKQLRRFLCLAQLDETHGLSPDDVDYGGWDLSGWMQGKRTSPGTNVSVSSFAIQALKGDRSPVAEKTREKLSRWTRRIQNKDGGFHFHPKKDHEGNKAGWSDERFHAPKSYGTATADGIRILKALEYANGDDASVKQKELTREIDAAVKWIEQHGLGESVPGFSKNDNTSWSKGLFYYYSMSLLLEKDLFSDGFQKQSTLFADFLIKEQKSDGSWSNPSTRMREDDPMIATCFAIVALSQCIQK